MIRAITLSLACASTAVGLAMAFAGAIERGTTPADRALAVGLAVIVTLAAHLLPALVRSRSGRALWLAALLLTALGHAGWLVAAQHRAGQHRAGAVVESSKGRAMAEELAAIQARPLAAVAVDAAKARSRVEAAILAVSRCQPSRCTASMAAEATARAGLEAVEVELGQARRAAELRQQLQDEAGRLDAARAAAQGDPVMARLASVAGVDADALGTAQALASALLIELLGTMLWVQVLLRQANGGSAERVAHQDAAAKNPLHTRLRATIQSLGPFLRSDSLPTWRTPPARASPARS